MHLGCRFVIAGQCIPADIDSRRQHQPVIAELRVIAQGYEPSQRVDRLRLILTHGYAFGAERVIAEALRRDRAQAGNDGVAERAGRVRRVRLDHGHREPGLGVLQFPSASGAGKAAADNDDPGPALRQRRSGE